jgi:hypothetical protein
VGQMGERKMGKERFEVLLEEIRDKVQIIAEGHDALRGEMREMEGRLSDRIDSLDLKIDYVHKNLKNEIKVTSLALKSEINRVEDKINRVEDKLDAHMSHPIQA